MYKAEREKDNSKAEEKKSELLSMYYLTIISQNSHHVPLLVGGLGQISGHKRQNFRKFIT